MVRAKGFAACMYFSSDTPQTTYTGNSKVVGKDYSYIYSKR